MKVVDRLLLLPQFLRRVVGREDFWWIFGVATILSIGAVLSWLFWGQLHGEDESGSTTIRNIALILAAPIALVLAIWRSIVAERQAETNQRGLLNERYQKGAEMLGSGVLSVRLGGIYALRRLAEEHPEYHIQIMGLFCAFVRHPTEDSGRKVEKVELSDSDLEPQTLRMDVQEVMEAIRDRSKAGTALEKSNDFRLNFEAANLSCLVLQNANLSSAIFFAANLSGARLNKADLSETILWDANLSGARLSGANLSKAWLHGAPHGAGLAQAGLEMNLTLANLGRRVLGNVNLSGAWLNDGANLSNAHLDGADLTGAYLRNAILSGATLSRTNLSGTWLDNAILTNVIGLTQAQLNQAQASPGTPPKLEGSINIMTREPLVWPSDPLGNGG